ncbi:hypothetical protein [Lignipirellula cremea]|nr:hypothetical protein [Lignipirellula cremea]
MSLRQEASQRHGLTLLELILALALSVVLLGIIAMAINFQARALDLKRAEVEEAEIARAVLRYIESDLRGAVWESPPTDFSSASALSGLDSTNVDDLLGGNPGDPTNPTSPTTGGTGDGTSAGGDAPANPNTEDIAGTSQPAVRAGLYGNQYELQIDVSRLPRIDEYEAVLAVGSEVAEIPSDVKTIAYFLRQNAGAATGPSSSAGSGLSDSTPDVQEGLIRREMDRAVSLYAATNGQAFENAGQLLAEEVARLEFRYFDGAQWLLEWDSDQLGGLPLAVETMIAIRRADQDPDEMPVDDGPITLDNPYELVYRLVVRIPIAVPLEDETAVPVDDPAAEPVQP